jgi:hypothetical protein
VRLLAHDVRDEDAEHVVLQRRVVRKVPVKLAGEDRVVDSERRRSASARSEARVTRPSPGANIREVTSDRFKVRRPMRTFWPRNAVTRLLPSSTTSGALSVGSQSPPKRKRPNGRGASAWRSRLS